MVEGAFEVGVVRWEGIRVWELDAGTGCAGGGGCGGGEEGLGEGREGGAFLDGVG